jgi:predicted amidohydrolase YtcJ
MRADLLLLNGRVLTMCGRSASAIASAGGRILAVGRDAELVPLRDRRTRVIDLRGRPALPGFTDSHVHLAALALRLSRVRLDSAGSLKGALKLVRARARRTPRGAWITGEGFDKNRWGEEFPTRHDLDRAAPGNPAVMRSRDGHTLWLNSLALQVCGIASGTPTPPGGVIAQDQRGEPTGILQEAATALVHESPAFDESRPLPGDLAKALRLLTRQGITSVHLMEEMPIFSALQALRERGQLAARVTIYRSSAALDGLIAADMRSGLGDEWLRFGGVKLFMDGSLGSQTAWLFQPYDNTAPASCGVPQVSPEELRHHVRRAAQAGIACAIHAIGDRANAEALDALEAVRDIPPPLPHRVEHCQLVRPGDVPRFAGLGVIASMQPCHILGDIDAADRYWGRRSRHAYPIKSLLSAGATLAFGSDAPVETADPLAGIYAAVARRTVDGRPASGWHRREQGITVAQAARAYTVGPATATGEAHLKGRLAPGYLADIVVLPRSISRLRGRGLLDVRPDLVIVGGHVAYRRRDHG